MSITKLSDHSLFENLTKNQESLLETLRGAAKKIAPVWPLENFVAVNPYLGFTNRKFEQVAQELAAAGGIQMTLPSSFYLDKIQKGVIDAEDLNAILEKRNASVDATDFIENLERNGQRIEETASIPSVADIATLVTNKDWNRFMTGRVSSWAASYFDKGQAIWSAADSTEGIFASWKAEAMVDRTPELSGLKRFRQHVKNLPDHPLEATQSALHTLGVQQEGISLYLHSLLLGVGGWAAYAARLDWDSELHGGSDGKLIEFLAILTCWEACLLKSLDHTTLNSEWEEARKILSLVDVQKELNKQLADKLILQEAFDLANQRTIIRKFQNKNPSNTASSELVKAQAVFCIDVRSEVYRRHLELADPDIETIGFAGFFAFPVKYVPIGHEHGEDQCPVLLTTGATVMEQIPDPVAHKKALNGRLLSRQIHQVWKSFKSGAITCFSFVSPMGLSYLPKLFTDTFGITRPVPLPDKVGLNDAQWKSKKISLKSETIDNQLVGMPLEQQITLAKNALTAMSLVDDFGKFVMIVGHGAATVNNPHASGYDCGACGGRSGEANARVAAEALNNKAVRAGLQKENIFIPVETIFLACLHNTTTDEVTIFNEYDIPSERSEELVDLKNSLKIAGEATRNERTLRFPKKAKADIHKDILFRSNDWSQIRPEWGLAGCSNFIVAPRERSKGVDLEGKSFLHSYDWKRDQEFAVLELIMTAPMVVTSWINLQYYGSTVDARNFGSGNKTLHNITAGVGVLEGYTGDLRVGLPLQSIHDGENWQHEPLRLNVIIEAPTEAMNNVLKKHESVKDLCDNGWVQLLGMDEDGKISTRYVGDLNWEEI